jgi:hypothetical protein
MRGGQQSYPVQDRGNRVRVAMLDAIRRDELVRGNQAFIIVGLIEYGTAMARSTIQIYSTPSEDQPFTAVMSSAHA